MDGARLANRMRYGLLAVLLFAAAMCVWSVVLGVRLAVDSSVPGGIAVVMIAVLALAGIAWRVRFNWGRIHRPRPWPAQRRSTYSTYPTPPIGRPRKVPS